MDENGDGEGMEDEEADDEEDSDEMEEEDEGWLNIHLIRFFVRHNWTYTLSRLKEKTTNYTNSYPSHIIQILKVVLLSYWCWLL